MLTHRWISFTLFLVFIVTIAAQDTGGKFPRRLSENNDDDDVNDDDNKGPVKPPLNVPEAPTQPARPPEKTYPTKVDTRRPSSTPLAASSECKADVQKYCNKGGEKLLPNLKVLQCVDDLDNVR